MECIDLGKVLQEEQKYVAESAAALGIDVKAVQHDIATDTCREKAELLGWDDVSRVVKAVFFYRGSDIYGFVFPEFGEADSPLYLDRKKALPKILGLSKAQAKRFHNSYCPVGMEYGTCTPFALEGSFEGSYEKLLKEMFIHDVPELDDQVVDISIGGKGEEAHKVSLHLPYRGIHDILTCKFGDRIRKADLF